MRDLGVSVCGLWMGSGCREGEILLSLLERERERERLVCIFVRALKLK